jgi:hypothetical protein
MTTKNVLLSLTAVAGLASAALAQNAQFDLRVVLDNDPASPFFGTSEARLPGFNSLGVWTTAVGLTIQARVRTTGTFNNFGIIRFTNSAAAGATRISHNDATSNQTSSLWSSITNVWQRGLTGENAEDRGVFGAYRNTVTAAQNIESGNGTFATAPVNTSPFSFGNLQNGFMQSVGGSGQIVAADMARTASGTANPNFAAGATSTTVVTSPWANLYRFIFVPRTNNGSDLARGVTVTVAGRLQYGGTQGTVGGLFILNPATTPAVQTSATVTFAVPTPGAAALLGLGGLAVARRRR